MPPPPPASTGSWGASRDAAPAPWPATPVVASAAASSTAGWATEPAAGALDGDEVTFDDDGLRVEALEHDGVDLHDEMADVHVGHRGRWLRGVAVVAVLAVIGTLAGRAVIDRSRPTTMVVQTSAGSATVTTDLATAPTARWSLPVPDGASVSMVTQDATTVYVLLTSAGAMGQQVSVLALERADGTERWRYEVTGVDGLVQATSRGLLVNVFESRAVTGSLLEPADGTVRWQVDGVVTPAPDGGDVALVQQVSGQLRVGARFVALSTGLERWSPLGVLRTAIGLDVAVDATCESLTGRAIDDGRVRWTYPAGGGEPTAAADLCPTSQQVRLAIVGDRIVVADGTDFVALDSEGRERWRVAAAGRTLAGQTGTYLLVQDAQAPGGRVYLDPDGRPVDQASFATIRGRGRDSTLLVRRDGDTMMLVDQGDTVVRLDRRTGLAAGAPMAGTGPIGVGQRSVYRVNAAGDALVSYSLSSGENGWTAPLDAAAVGARPVIWSADQVIVVGAVTGPLGVYG